MLLRIVTLTLITCLCAYVGFSASSSATQQVALAVFFLAFGVLSVAIVLYSINKHFSKLENQQKEKQ